MTAAASLLILRHAATDWNEQGLLQGRNDIPISVKSSNALPCWRLPDGAEDCCWFVSPLLRARQTAAGLKLIPQVEQVLTEMSWGAWEGLRLRDLRSDGRLTPDMERLGRDFRPPDGESPADVQLRLRPWLENLGKNGGNYGAVSHKGVIRALYAMASGWDMGDDPPHKLRRHCAHLFSIAADGRPGVVTLNLPLAPVKS